MATFNPGTGTLKSTSLEAAAMEAAQILQNAERASTVDPQPNNIAVNYFTGDNVVQVRATLPINQSVSASAQAVFVAEDYIGTSFSNGGGDLTSSTLPAAVLELFQRLQIAEKSASSNPNNITITYDTETEIATINAEMPVSFTVSSNGSVSIVAAPYLA
ncbi:hypothetical protein CEN50_22835 [Fischerella thermalis CCMEE 5268]|uniref:Uncharacterized protein n=1 Tax=Fischerella thermalis CCMEE 5268 TaxID=2019662 RepID=A0A2N6KAH4_9CYAN|nr:hypothetical protein [Fischerella thermalis]PLZ95296.1 hypothetical protein CEN50_22835 [Fischerella thermalis CCMEE 5268]